MSVNHRSSLSPDPACPIAGVVVPDVHSRATRLLHAGLAVLVISQLGSSLLMVAPLDDHAENVFFEIHEYTGLAALVLATAFFINVFMRRGGTPVSRLIPWFSSASRLLLWQDITRHWQTLRSRRLPDYESGAPLASAVHGLGLLLILSMAATGGLFYIALLLGAKEAVWVSLDLDLHRLLATLAWTYLIGHAGVALLYRYVGQLALARMWNFGKDDNPASTDQS